MSKDYCKLTKEERVQLNRLGREQTKMRLLLDLKMDLEICKLEDWDMKEYLNELKTLIDGFYEKTKGKE